jgi:tRNA (adenine57-N1/adenine58-N1)-methyltransferase catalytic subunit
LSEDAQTIDSWKAKRKAVIHTVEISPAHAANAQKVVRGFRHGLYYGNVDFHVGEPAGFLSNASTVQKRSRFLSHVVLDMPASHEQLELVSKHMRNDAKLLVFNPSVTQIAECVQVVHKLKLPLRLERVVELAGSFSGGRDWDLRLARIRKPSTASASQAEPVQTVSWFRRMMSTLLGTQPAQPVQPAVEEKYAMVCRPMAGERIVVGGFVGIWTRNPV